MALKQIAKHRDSPIVLAEGVISKAQVVGSRNLIGLRSQALSERGLGLSVLALQVVHCPHRVFQDGIVGMLLQKPREKRRSIGEVALSDVGGSQNINVRIPLWFQGGGLCERRQSIL